MKIKFVLSFQNKIPKKKEKISGLTIEEGN